MAASQPETVIVGLKAHSHQDQALLRLAVHSLKQVMAISSISSVYRVNNYGQQALHIHDLRTYSFFEGFVVALAGATSFSMAEFAREIERLERSFQVEPVRHSVKALLYFYGAQTTMTPLLTVPDPDFHLLAESVLPVAEICPDFVHPVLKRTIRELAKPFAATTWGEFVAQGKAILDF